MCGRAAAPRLTALLALSACSHPGATPYPGECVSLEVTDASPGSGEQNVATGSPVDLWLSAPPDPDVLTPDTLVLTTGITRRVGAFQADLLSRRVRFVPARPLDPDLTYRITIGRELRSLAGCRVRDEQHFTFTTGRQLGTPPSQTPPAFSDVQAVLTASCVACHSGETAAAQLDLRPGMSRAFLVGAPSTQSSTMQRVTARDSARSYLLRKLIPASETGAPLPGVMGARMPPGPPLDESALRLVSDWIDSGAGE